MTGFYEERRPPFQRPRWTLRINHVGRYVAGLLVAVRYQGSPATPEVHWFVGVGDGGVYDIYSGPQFADGFGELSGAPSRLQLSRDAVEPALAFQRVILAQGHEERSPFLSDTALSQLSQDLRRAEYSRLSGWDLREVHRALTERPEPTLRTDSAPPGLTDKIVAFLQRAWSPHDDVADQLAWAHRGFDVSAHLDAWLLRRDTNAGRGRDPWANEVLRRQRAAALGPRDKWHADDLPTVVAHAQLILRNTYFETAPGGDVHSAWYWLGEIRRQRARVANREGPSFQVEREFPDAAFDALGVPEPASRTYHYFFRFRTISAGAGAGAHGEAQLSLMSVWEVPNATGTNDTRGSVEHGTFGVWILAAGAGFGGGAGGQTTEGRAVTHEPWSAVHFPGRVEYAKAGASASLGPAGVEAADDHLVLYGNGQRMPMTVETPTVSGNANVPPRGAGRRPELCVAVVMGKGWVHAVADPVARRFQSRATPRESQVAARARGQVSFATGDAHLTPAGLDELGMFLACEYALFGPPTRASRRARLRLDAHASRLDRDDANRALTHYRNENVAQAIIDILGRTGVFAVDAHAEGEAVAERAGDPPSSDLAARRRVDITLANQVTVSLWAR
ncbi:MAG: hypothetical protein R3B40_29360 [Polyangiales bacterium]